MLTPETLRRIQRLSFKTSKRASEVFAGQYVSAFKGRGMEFAEVREYQVGDDIRAIDWNVTARSGQPHVKVYHEEREMTVMLLLDLSGSLDFGTRARFKRDLLAEVAGTLAYLAIRTNDRVGAILFAGGIERYIPPRKGPQHVWALIREIFTYEARDKQTDIAEALDYLNRVVKRRAIVFLISDMQAQGYEQALKITARKHDLTVIRLHDAAETELPDFGWLRLRDPESGQFAVVSPRRLKRRWQAGRLEQARQVADLISRAGAERLDLATSDDVAERLSRFFEARRRRLA
ncbi:MAG: hypothetical protein BWY87_01238 [Deltaproteobacteria bacterium ADurb.Bin510]|nr:MAG: hypothetical protein BWY87_01238 [Deltaproteobacteria bacterium ADurb.Bin510]